mmetsp:Transcript_51235/g.58722  ORF Transcript_51235/g.58722 Transcript_51235/m.58722 type:complete len:103 (+) Transcript_51235:113-421(+)
MTDHTILLIQFKEHDGSRTYQDYDSMTRCIDGICNLYEQELKEMNQGRDKMAYDLTDLFAYLDRLASISCLVLKKQDHVYIPHGKDWIKSKIYQCMKKQSIQ